MNASNIVEKAQRAGLDIGNGSTNSENLKYIASQVGVDDLEELNEVLDDMLKEDNDKISEQPESLYDEQSDGSDFQVSPQRRERFGEREYNNARDENGKYNKDHYKSKQEELDKKLDDAKHEKKLNNKKVGIDENGRNKYKNKNIIDKAKDRVNVAKARQDAISNKLANAKANAYRAMHPGEALKDAAKAKAKSAAKSAGKKVGSAAAKAGKKAGQAIGKALSAAGKALINFLLANPIVLIIIAALILIILILVLIFGSDSGGGGSAIYGLYGYEYVEPKCTEITITNGEYAGTYDIEEYVAGVIQGEVGGFIGGERHEAAKAGAVAARSFVEANISEDCTVISSTSFQVYRNPSDAAIEVANETRGLVLVDESTGNIRSTQYDAFCTDSPQDDPDNYIVCQKSQKIPRSWVDAQSGIKDSWKAGTRSEAHGNGMSQWGAAYLAEQGYTFEEILAYYYDDTELKSIYPSFDVTNNWTQTISTSASSSIPTTILSTPINDLLSSSQYDELNELIYNNVASAGVGSRGAVVAAAVTPIKYLAENFNVVIPYTLGGGHYMEIYSNSTGANIQKTTTTYYGVDPDWGTRISHTWSGYYYDKYGPDCSSWVPWVFYNAGISIGPRLAAEFQYLGTRYSMSEYTAQPGDILENDHHVTVVVGVDTNARNYYIAHASGGQYGTIITPVSFDSNDYYIVDMSEYIASHAIDAETYQNNYRNGVLAY